PWIIAFGLGAIPVWGVWSFLSKPVEPDVYFHLAIASDYAFGPHKYQTHVAEGVLAHYKADRELLFHVQLAAPHSWQSIPVPGAIDPSMV
ncbi:MAG: hypothetical protein V3R16_10630, partial [Nitrospirales bacterium]